MKCAWKLNFAIFQPSETILDHHETNKAIFGAILEDILGDIEPSWDPRELKKDPATYRDTPLPTPGGGGRGRGKPFPEGEEGSWKSDPLNHLRPEA